MCRDTGTEFCLVPSHCGFYWNGISDKLAKQGAMKNITLYNTDVITSIVKLIVHSSVGKLV